MSEQVTVSAEAAQLESSTAEIGRYITKSEFDTWPIPVADGHRQLQVVYLPQLAGNYRRRVPGIHQRRAGITRTKF